MSLDSNHIDGDEEIATTFRRLRRNGHSRQEAVRSILDRLGLSLAEAKRALLHHDTWAEVRAAGDSDMPNDASSGRDGAARQDPPPAPG